MNRTGKRAAILAAIAAIVILGAGLTPATASSLDWHGTSGTTFTSSATWKNSSVVRVKHGDGKVKANFSELPGALGSTHGMYMGVKSYTSRNWFLGSPKEFRGGQLNENITVAGNMSGGKKFFIAVKRIGNGDCFTCHNNFKGKLYY